MMNFLATLSALTMVGAVSFAFDRGVKRLNGKVEQLEANWSG